MSKHSRRYRKQFDCGHHGFGQYCHHCADQAAAKAHKQAQRAAWKVTFDNDEIDLAKLPRQVILKTRWIIDQLKTGTAYYHLSGKRLKGDRNIVSIPVTYHYRLLCKVMGASLVPQVVMSHEDYNGLVSADRHLRDRFG